MTTGTEQSSSLKKSLEKVSTIVEAISDLEPAEVPYEKLDTNLASDQIRGKPIIEGATIGSLAEINGIGEIVDDAYSWEHETWKIVERIKQISPHPWHMTPGAL